MHSKAGVRDRLRQAPKLVVGPTRPTSENRRGPEVQVGAPFPQVLGKPRVDEAPAE